MKLYFSGHNYKYGVEQMLSTLFPGEKPEYPGGRPEGDRMEISLSEARVYITAVCSYYSGGRLFRGRCAVKREKTNETDRDSLCQYAIKNAIYRAVIASGLTEQPWGALTGVRPGKLMHGIVRRTGNREQAVAKFMKDYSVTEKRAELCYDATMYTLKAEETLGKRDICLYVGIPFCPTRCAYCSFVSQAVGKSMQLIPDFLEALEKEIEAAAEQVRKNGLRVSAIYMGGGTPTTLTAEELDRLCGRLAECFDLAGLKEYCVEAGRPDTITREKLVVLRRHGVDRISVNPQTMNDPVLEAIGRRHTAEDIIRALSVARDVRGFAINMDLIAGLPADSVNGFKKSMDMVLELDPENITVHTLSLKRGSRLMLAEEKIPGAAEVGEMLEYAYERLRNAGYEPYYLYRQKNMSGGFENTGWTKPGHENLYNICMMEEINTIVAMGAGGSSKLIDPEGGRNIRMTAPKYPLEYIQSIEKTCADKEKISEFYEGR